MVAVAIEDPEVDAVVEVQPDDLIPDVELEVAPVFEAVDVPWDALVPPIPPAAPIEVPDPLAAD